jgi:hypothetical protein
VPADCNQATWQRSPLEAICWQRVWALNCFCYDLLSHSNKGLLDESHFDLFELPSDYHQEIRREQKHSYDFAKLPIDPSPQGNVNLSSRTDKQRL